MPEDLYRQVKARSALEGRTVREVTVALFRQWLAGAARPQPERGEVEVLSDGRPAPAWFGLARPYMRRGADPRLSAIRESAARGWAREVAESEARIQSARRRTTRKK